eukprot:CAMPEP_0172642466 /NCGR_PEP_ID=MMETSP1068-20121228/232338_1 /TAXON_ID=35684 /ORGANISM="Pseudopedinella elastica, Strain CCMP716" /LENGTH=81 /DNA_ID=CAMNT_0013456295 /DNA_START=409 /DNA_END=651 /DNA_ORIENTATION=-
MAYEMLGTNKSCHKGPLEWDKFASRPKPGDKLEDSVEFRKYHGGAWEHLNHVILGGRPLLDKPPNTAGYCATSFLPQESCR